MLPREENDLVTRVGPGTPLGNVMRRYWIPVCTAEQLPHPDGAPLRLSVLGEHFVAFRDTNGKIGVLAIGRSANQSAIDLLEAAGMPNGRLDAIKPRALVGRLRRGER